VPDVLLEALSDEEHGRAERSLRGGRGLIWARSRAVLRALLGRYLEQDARDIRLIAGQHGKLELAADSARPQTRVREAQRPPGLHFNLSHSGELALYAFTHTGPVGVDLEIAGRRVYPDTLAARALGPSEIRRLARLDSPTRELEFLRAWVRHEAKLKCHGAGLAGPSIGVAIDELTIGDLPLGPGMAGAVAAAGPYRELACWEWPAERGRQADRAAGS
jgi:4'-phosphopantetheinyl transferase